MSAPPAVWKGASALRPFLVAIDDLSPFPGNPRRGDIALVKESLERFGQVRPILTNGERTIVAGHHVVLAARELGWSHVAAIANDFEDEEARRYLLMDNRSHDTGAYDLEGLNDQLTTLRESFGGLAGTGYDDAYYRTLERDLAKLRADLEPPDHFPPLDPSTLETAYRCPSCGYEWSGNPSP